MLVYILTLISPLSLSLLLYLTFVLFLSFLSRIAISNISLPYRACKMLFVLQYTTGTRHNTLCKHANNLEAHYSFDVFIGVVVRRSSFVVFVIVFYMECVCGFFFLLFVFGKGQKVSCHNESDLSPFLSLSFSRVNSFVHEIGII